MAIRLARGLSLLLVAAGIILQCQLKTSLAAQKGEAAAGDASTETKGKGKGKADSAHGRLPAHYADLVDAEQRAKIYDLQAQHEPEIKKLREALKAAVVKRDSAIADVLTPAQQKKLAALQAADAGKKGKGSAKPDMTESDEAADDETPAQGVEPKSGKSSKSQ
jgi:Spy/CpxP family protein refolding chaperone